MIGPYYGVGAAYLCGYVIRDVHHNTGQMIFKALAFATQDAQTCDGLFSQ